MSIENTIILGISLIIICILFVSLFEYLLPMFVKLEFDDVCRTYFLIAEENNGLNAKEVDAITSQLSKMKIKDIKITCNGPNTARKGELSKIEIVGTYEYSGFLTLFKKTTKVVQLIFQKDYLARKIVM